MELLQVMKNRRSIRKYTGEKIPSDKLDIIIQAGLLAPRNWNETEQNKVHWESFEKY